MNAYGLGEELSGGGKGSFSRFGRVWCPWGGFRGDDGIKGCSFEAVVDEVVWAGAGVSLSVVGDFEADRAGLDRSLFQLGAEGLASLDMAAVGAHLA